MPGVPAYEFLAPRDTLLELAGLDVHRDAFGPLAHDAEHLARLSFVEHVLAPQFHGVNPESVGQFVHRRFEAGEPLNGAVSAEGARGHLVRVHHVPAETDRHRLVVARQGLGAGAHEGGERVFAVGASVGEHLHIDRPQHSVWVRAEPHCDAHLVAGEGGLEDLAAGEGEAGGPARLHGDHGDIGFAVDVLCPADTSAYPRLYDADPVQGHLEGESQEAPRVPGVLRRRHDDEPTVQVDVAEGRVRLEGDVLLGLRMYRRLHSDRRSRKFLFHIADLHAVGCGDVARRLEADGEHLVDTGLGVDDDGIVEGLLEIEHGLQHLILDLDEGGGLLRDRFALGGDHGHLVADVAHVFVEDEAVVWTRLRVALSCPRYGNARAVLPGEHAGDSGKRERLDGVDRENAGEGVGAAHEFT